MATLHFTTRINSPCETVFALIADLAHYDLWLPGSRVFGGVTQVFPTSTGAGTTYSDGPMRGSITEYDPPKRIIFNQFMPVKIVQLPGQLDVCVDYTLEMEGQTTQVKRDVTFTPHGILKAVQPLVAFTIRRESGRLLAALKRYVESGKAH